MICVKHLTLLANDNSRKTRMTLFNWANQTRKPNGTINFRKHRMVNLKRLNELDTVEKPRPMDGGPERALETRTRSGHLHVLCD